VPFRGFGLPVGLPDLWIRQSSSLGISSSLEVFLLECIVLLVDDPTLLLAVSSALWFSVSSSHSDSRRTLSAPSTSSAFLQSIPQLTLAGSPQRSSSSHGLSFPTAHLSLKGPHCRQVSTPALVPPSGFGYPLDGFLPLRPSEYRSTHSAPGIHPSKHCSLLRYVDVSADLSPPAVPPASYTKGKPFIRRCRPRLLGFDPHSKH
jgi:hypothetical protein